LLRIPPIEGENFSKLSEIHWISFRQISYVSTGRTGKTAQGRRAFIRLSGFVERDIRKDQIIASPTGRPNDESPVPFKDWGWRARIL
jgi:hypothetical protein